MTHMQFPTTTTTTTTNFNDIKVILGHLVFALDSLYLLIDCAMLTSLTGSRRTRKGFLQVRMGS